MKVIFIDEEVKDLDLTVGKEYRVLAGNLGTYLIRTDKDKIEGIFARRFKITDGHSVVGGKETLLRDAYKLPYVNYLVKEERLAVIGKYDYVEDGKSFEDKLLNKPRLQRMYVNWVEEGTHVSEELLEALYNVNCTKLIGAIELTVNAMDSMGKYKVSTVSKVVVSIEFQNALDEYRWKPDTSNRKKILDMLWVNR